MYVCNEDHDGIVYDAPNCPLCVAPGKIEDLKTDIETLEEKISSLEEEE